MKTILTGVGVLIIIAGALFFLTPREELPAFETFAGDVVEVDLDSVAFDGPALLVLENEDGERRTVAVPSMGLPLCAAFENIASPFEAAVGDRASVKGSADEEGRIVPCEDAAHYLEIISSVRNAAVGFAFTYRKGPDGYVVLEDTESEHEDFFTGLMLFNRAEYEELQNSDEAREGPPSMQVRVFENSDKLGAAVWAQRNPRESNIELAFAEPEEAVIGGAEAVKYTVDGLYPIETYIVAHDSRIFVLAGSYLEKSTAIYRDFQDLVNSFTFVQAAGQM